MAAADQEQARWIPPSRRTPRGGERQRAAPVVAVARTHAGEKEKKTWPRSLRQPWTRSFVWWNFAQFRPSRFVGTPLSTTQSVTKATLRFESVRFNIWIRQRSVPIHHYLQ